MKVTKMEITEMRNKCPRENDPTKQQNTKSYTENAKKSSTKDQSPLLVFCA
jgi:hypothetical protein